MVFATALALLFALYRFEFRGGGALAALVLGLAVNVLWVRDAVAAWFGRVLAVLCCVVLAC